MRTIWLVASGSYSDYSVHAAFATEELAQAFCDRENAKLEAYGDPYEVEDRPLFDAMPEAWTAYVASARLLHDGTLTAIETFKSRLNGTTGDEPGERVQKASGDSVSLVVNYRRSEDEAVKALRDLAARVRAEREGVA